MSLKALGTKVGQVREKYDSEYHKDSVPSTAEEEYFLGTGGMNLSGDSLDGDISKESRYTPRPSRRQYSCSTIIAVFSSVLAVILLISVEVLLNKEHNHENTHEHTHEHTHNTINYVPATTDNLKAGDWPLVEAGSRVIVDCGKTIEEARARGCVWDLMSFSWTHPACYNKNVSETFLNQYGPWRWYENDHNKPGAEILNLETLPEKTFVWAEEHYHVAHCSYLLKLLHLAGMSGHLVTDEGIVMSHTDHCVMTFLDEERAPFKKISTRVQLLFGQCVTIRDVN